MSRQIVIDLLEPTVAVCQVKVTCGTFEAKVERMDGPDGHYWLFQNIGYLNYDEAVAVAKALVQSKQAAHQVAEKVLG